MAYFAVELVFVADTERRLAVRPLHRDYLGTLEEKGKLVLSGPWTSDTGALLVYRVADEAEVRDLVEHDPYSEAEVISQVRITEWNPLRGILAPHLEA
jgi:uncharacterized protein